ncbi:uncharacterized protein LY89DRAFT_14232 [Mollisia scopiformis]|uniref:Uncharacterized protein n=1 Tax=Mollisia scopiformis TaxID=149040 RepID=A0A194XW11_MOLSC|nr:uncharacterized protein LY89DRAFT_14232 [Mollisia scopiformis]KUJ24204.1 hypothetical protein LY89DRAFT_14232 [Mollisia scopiformis]
MKFSLLVVIAFCNLTGLCLSLPNLPIKRSIHPKRRSLIVTTPSVNPSVTTPCYSSSFS